MVAVFLHYQDLNGTQDKLRLATKQNPQKQDETEIEQQDAHRERLSPFPFHISF